jgi:hypothetical protein
MSINSKSNAVRGAKNPLPQSATGKTVSSGRTVLETVNGRTPLPTSAQRQRIEQMYRLANIFASIFETLPDEHVLAIATNREAA